MALGSSPLGFWGLSFSESCAPFPATPSPPGSLAPTGLQAQALSATQAILMALTCELRSAVCKAPPIPHAISVPESLGKGEGCCHPHFIDFKMTADGSLPREQRALHTWDHFTCTSPLRRTCHRPRVPMLQLSRENEILGLHLQSWGVAEPGLPPRSHGPPKPKLFATLELNLNWV